MEKKSIAFVTLGCAKNTVYSEYMMGLVKKSHYTLVDQVEDANVIVVNTCGFINAAKEEGINTILDLNELKVDGKCDYLIAMGCMVQKYASEMEEALPELDLLLGSTSYDDIISEIDALYNRKTNVKSYVDLDWHLLNKEGYQSRIISTPSYYAYLTISEGCNNHCTFCAIPEMQGPYRSRTIEDIVEEAKLLVTTGVRELIVIAQDITYYGKDIYNEFKLPMLLRELCAIEELKWIRLLYAYPNNFTDELIETIAKEEKICNYIDIPLQHADDGILKSMNRKITQNEIRILVQKLRERIPDMIIRTTFIVGFPGETEEAYQNLLSFIEEMKLDRVGVFPYSQEDNTPAGRMENQLSEELKEERAQNLMDIQFEIMYENHEKVIGQVRDVLVDEVEGEILLCRSYSEAPDIDPFVIVPYNTAMESYEIGQPLTVKIESVHEYDFVGSIVKA